MELLTILLLFLSLSILIHSPPTQAGEVTVPGTFHRATKQQIITTLAPDSPSTSQPFLTSPGGKYRAYFLRRATVPGAGGFGNDFCFIEIKDAATGESMWESECAPVSTSNACSLVFSDSGLEVFDGSNSVWSAEAGSGDSNPLQSLELVDEGDMRIRDKGGELAWKASDDPRQNQQCGEPGSPGLAPAQPPFAEPVGGSTEMPFGQQQQQSGPGHHVHPDGGHREQHEVGEAGEAFGLVDSTPYDSGSCKGVEDWVVLGFCMLLGLMAFTLLF